MDKNDFKTLAVALAAANGHPDPYGYADKVLEHVENPPPVPAPAETPVPDAPATDAPAGDSAQ